MLYWQSSGTRKDPSLNFLEKAATINSVCYYQLLRQNLHLLNNSKKKKKKKQKKKTHDLCLQLTTVEKNPKKN